MKDRKKQIEEMATDIQPLIASQINLAKCTYVLQENQDKYNGMCWEADFKKISELLYNAGYRKMDEVTLNIDLGDCTPEQINEIMEKFSNAAETPCVAVPNNDKETPQCVTHESSIYTDWTCPRCKNVVSKREKWGDTNVRILYKYCPFCGQHLKGENE